MHINTMYAVEALKQSMGTTQSELEQKLAQTEAKLQTIAQTETPVSGPTPRESELKVW